MSKPRMRLTALVLAFLLTTSFVMTLATVPEVVSAYALHDPIFIEGDAGFTTANGVTGGSGTASDPYIIEGWEIESFPSNGIEIRYTEVHFIIQDCYVHDATGGFSGAIKIRGCSNGTVRDCTCSGCSSGIFLLASSNNRLVDNTCSDNWEGIRLTGGSSNSLTGNVISSPFLNEFCGGIYLDESNRNYLANNTCSLQMSGCIELDYSDDNTLIDNTCTGQGYWRGISLDCSSSNNVIRNTCSGHYYGILIRESPDNRFFNNTCSDNVGYGFCVSWNSYDPGGNNRIWNNTFENNNGSGDSYDLLHCQACDNGGGNWWNSSEGYGNYWSDWTTPDVAPQDGIVDSPYEIAGDAGAKDYYPLTTPGTQDNEPAAPPAEVDVGVGIGDWIRIDYDISGAPSGTPLPMWIRMEILDVDGTRVEVLMTVHMNDGTEESDTVTVDVVEGGEVLGFSGLVIPSRLTVGDTVCLSGFGEVELVGEATRRYAGATRSTVYASVSTYEEEITYYWDKETGVLVESSGTSAGMTIVAKATETNMWDAQSLIDPADSVLLYALVVVAIVIVVAAVLLVRRKRKQRELLPEAGEPPMAPPGT